MTPRPSEGRDAHGPGSDVVIVGAGLGGVRTAEALRRHGHQGTIVMVGAERHRPYDRPPLTKAVLRGEKDETTLGTDLDALGVDLRLGVRVTGVDPANRRLDLDDGSVRGYDALVLAPGATPRVLPGADGLAGAHVVRTIDDALRLRDEVRATKRLVVVGGGFIGCEVAASAHGMGAEVDLVEVLPAPLYRVLGELGSRLVSDLLTTRGVNVHSGVAVDEVLHCEGVVAGVRLANGTVLESPTLAIGLGVVPDLSWLASSGIEVDNGILCDSGGRTSVEDVWAVGDAASWRHPRTHDRHRFEHWTTTTEQAAVVGANIVAGSAGTASQLEATPYFWSDVFDVKIQALGLIDPTDTVERVDPGGRPVLIYSRERTVTGLVGFGAARHIMKFRSQLQDQVAVEEMRQALSH